MSAKEFARQLKTEIEGFAAKGQNSISIDTLTSGLENFITSAEEESEGILIERFKAYLQSEVEKEKYNYAAELEMFKSVIQTGQNALKAIVLLNGGAAVALLAFIGKLTEVSKSEISLFALPLTIFVSGAFLSTISSGFTYLTQLIYSEDGKWRNRCGLALQAVTIGAGVGALSLFGYGTYLAYNSFVSLAAGN